MAYKSSGKGKSTLTKKYLSGELSRSLTTLHIRTALDRKDKKLQEI